MEEVIEKRDILQEDIEQIRESILSYFSGEEEVLIERTLSIIEELDKEHPEVSYHNRHHSFSMARYALDGWQNIINNEDNILTNKQREIARKIITIIAIGVILHDLGYYESDPVLGMMKFNHEERGIEKIKEMSQELGLSNDEINVISIIIRGTILKNKLPSIEDIWGKTSLTKEEQTLLLDSLGIKKDIFDELNDQERVVLLATSLVGVLDVIGTDSDLLSGKYGLKKEFDIDRKHLELLIEEGDANLLATAEAELKKIPQIEEGEEGAKKDARGFMKFVALPRASQTGLLGEDFVGGNIPRKVQANKTAIGFED